MGTFFHPITIIGPNGEETIEALVDPSSLFAILPAELLGRLGIEPIETRQFRFEDGSVEERAFGEARGRLAGRDGHLAAIFGQNRDPVRIGQHTLTSFIVEADMEREILVEKVFQHVQHI